MALTCLHNKADLQSYIVIYQVRLQAIVYNFCQINTHCYKKCIINLSNLLHVFFTLSLGNLLLTYLKKSFFMYRYYTHTTFYTLSNVIWKISDKKLNFQGHQILIKWKAMIFHHNLGLSKSDFILWMLELKYK